MPTDRLAGQADDSFDQHLLRGVDPGRAVEHHNVAAVHGVQVVGEPVHEQPVVVAARTAVQRRFHRLGRDPERLDDEGAQSHREQRRHGEQHKQPDGERELPVWAAARRPRNLAPLVRRYGLDDLRLIQRGRRSGHRLG